MRAARDSFRALILPFALLAVTTGAAPAAPGSARWVLTWQSTGPSDLYPRDVRWTKNGLVILSAGRGGLLRNVPVGRAPLVGGELFLAQGQPGLAAFPLHLATDGRYWVTASPSLELAWTDLGSRYGRRSVGVVNDVDAFEGRVAYVGCGADGEGRWAADGGMVFLGTLDKNLEDIRPLFQGEQRGNDSPMVRCGMMSVGKVRFLPNGDLVAFAGVAGGLLVFDRDGGLRRLFPASALGIDVGCDIAYGSPLYQNALTDIHLRFVWLNRRLVVDDIVPLSDGIGLIVRNNRGATSWSLLSIMNDGTIQQESLPIPSGSPFARLQGDIKDGKLLLLKYEAVSLQGNGVDPFAVYLLEYRP